MVHKTISRLFLSFVVIAGVFVFSPGESQSTDIREGPGMLVGGVTGIGYHRVSVSDVTTGATKQTSSGTNDFGIDLGVFGDFGIFDVGTGNIGVMAYFNFNLPDAYYGAGIIPRYKLEFLLNPESTLLSVAPWGGVNLNFGFIDEIDSDYFMNLGFSLGCDFQLFTKGLYAVVGVDINMVNLVNPSASLVNVEGQDREYSTRYNNFLITVGLAYRIF